MRSRMMMTSVGSALLIAATTAPVAAQPTIEEVAGGLNAPRGLILADDGSILVAEAGLAGDTCPMGEEGFCFGPTGSIARVSEGSVERVVEGLPSAGAGPEVVGPSDVIAGADDTLYAIVNWGGDPGERPEGDLSGWIISIDADGNVEPVVDVAAFEATGDPDAEFSGGVLDTNPHSLIQVDDGFVVADAGGNALLGVAADGTVSVIAVFPPQMHEFPAELLAALGAPPESDGEMAPEGEEMAPEGEEMAADEMAEGEEMAPEGEEMASEGGMVPIPEIQYLAYLHNAEDQIRGEAASLSFFSNGQFRNPMVVRIAGYAYQRGFGGHFHNDHSVAVLRDIPGLIVASPAHPSDAGPMLRTCVAAAIADGTVAAFVEPIARYHTRDLHQPGDEVWTSPYPEP